MHSTFGAWSNSLFVLQSSQTCRDAQVHADIEHVLTCTYHVLRAPIIAAVCDIMDKSTSLTLCVIGPVVCHVMTRYATASAAYSGAPAISSSDRPATVESFRPWAATITAFEGRLSSCWDYQSNNERVARLAYRGSGTPCCKCVSQPGVRSSIARFR